VRIWGFEFTADAPLAARRKATVSSCPLRDACMSGVMARAPVVLGLRLGGLGCRNDCALGYRSTRSKQGGH
jgi:hypothetical protein